MITNIRILILNCRGEKIKLKNNTKWHSTKGQQVRKVST